MDSRRMRQTPGYGRWTGLALAVAVPFLLSGCIVCPWCWECDNQPPRMSMITVSVSDYYTGAPVAWASVDLYESDWWDWDYIGTWPVNSYGHTTLYGGYLYYDGNGGPEDEYFKVVVYASGYEALSYNVGLDYRHPAETLYFYLAPRYAREGDPERPEAISAEELEEDGPNGPRVLIGVPRESLPE
jgi:hypothetical protein